jgi:hypothetical protein
MGKAKLEEAATNPLADIKKPNSKPEERNFVFLFTAHSIYSADY